VRVTKGGDEMAGFVSGGRALSSEDIERGRKRAWADPAFRLAQNAVPKVGVDEVALRRELVSDLDHTVSHHLDDWKVTSQGRSGRCWLFAGLNLLRAGIMRELKIANFELSQSYLMFFDKLERANYFLTAMATLADRPLDDRTVAFLLDNVMGDGGQWNMFVALVEKYGVVPKAFMPETQSSGDSGRMNAVLRRVLRRATPPLRAAVTGHSDEAGAIVADTLDLVQRILITHLGTPPEDFVWQWRDTDKVFHRDGRLTPQQFRERYVSLPLSQYVCLVNDPRPTSPRGATFTVEWLGNVVGAPEVRYLNVETSVMKRLAAEAIRDGEPVWFGCDVGKMMSNELGFWDANLYDYEGVYGAPLELSKADRLLLHDSAMTHAMLFTGVDLLDDVPRRWRVENSWGADRGRDGYFTMNDSWFDEYVFEIAAPVSRLEPALRDALGREPIVLPAWDPMGALAGS